MATTAKRLATNTAGDFFVDSTCIDCGTCRWMAPAVFDQAGDASRVHTQPADESETLAALKALVACPTASIGTVEQHDVKRVAAGFPDRIADGVYHSGYHHADSFGAASYLVVRPEGNVLVDSPRFATPLVQGLEALGGVATMFLTHRDDVAEHDKFAAHFGCERILHAADVSSSTRAVERQPEGTLPLDLAPDLKLIPVPGHTRGSACLLYRDEFLFTGDHLAWNLDTESLYAFRRACWFDWNTQIESMERLAEFDFAHVLPGHGAPCHIEKSEMRERLLACVEWMKRER